MHIGNLRLSGQFTLARNNVKTTGLVKICKDEKQPHYSARIAAAGSAAYMHFLVPEEFPAKSSNGYLNEIERRDVLIINVAEIAIRLLTIWGLTETRHSFSEKCENAGSFPEPARSVSPEIFSKY